MMQCVLLHQIAQGFVALHCFELYGQHYDLLCDPLHCDV